MTLVDLLSHIDPKKLRVQVLGEVLDGKQTVAKGGITKLRFATTETLVDILANRRNALIIWGDTDDFKRACLAARAELSSATPREAQLSDSDSRAIPSPEQ